MRYFATIRQGIKVHHRNWWLVTSISMALFIGFCLSSYALNLEQKTGLRWLFHWRGPVTPPSGIVIVALNSSAGENLGLPRQTSAWPRSIYASLLEQLTAADARLVVMDIAFKEARSEDEDAALEEALADNGEVLLFKYLRRHQISTGNGFADIEEEIFPLPRFSQHALAVGSFVLPKYPAEVSHAYLFTELSRGREATQPLLAFLALQPEDVKKQIWSTLKPDHDPPDDIVEWTKIVTSKLPFTRELTDAEKQLFARLRLPNPIPINFYGPRETLSTLLVDRVLQMTPAQAREQFQDKVVYIGYSDNRQTEQQDAYRTVFSDRQGVDISGVEISATVLANLLEKNYLRAPSEHIRAGIVIIFLTMIILAHRLRARVCATVQLIAGGVYIAMAYNLFRSYFFWSPIALPMLALLLGNASMWAWHYLQQKKREQEIRYTLTQYLPSEAAQKLSRNFNRLEQQRQLVQGVCLLTDVQGYTRLAETLPPTELHALMNRYYAVLIDAVEKHGGFIGNLVGDGMLALWTGSQIDSVMCDAALRTVEEIQKRLAEEPDLRDALPTCFGLHGGQFSLGNLGHTGHFEYSPVGDMINTAARIEHLNRQLGTRMLCSSPVADQLSNCTTENLRFLGNFSLRNKSIPVALYTYAETPPDLRARFKRAYEYYENHYFGLALAQFDQIADEYADGPSRYFANACRHELNSK